MLTIVFDLDGTLVDTAPDLIDTLNFTLTQHGLAAVPYDEARPMIGGGARTLIERALAAEGLDCTPADVDRLYGPFVAHYGEHIADRSRLFPDVEAALDQLADAGHRLAVCTNKLEWLSKKLLQHARYRQPLRGDLRAGHVRRSKARSARLSGDCDARRRRP